MQAQKVLPQEKWDETLKILNIKHAAALQNKSFCLDHEYNDETVKVILTLKNDQETFCYPVEALMEHTKQQLDVEDAQLILLDYLDCYFESYLKEDEALLPLDWKSYTFENYELYLRGQILNKKLELEANRLLGLN